MNCSTVSKFSSGEEAFDHKNYFTATQMLENELGSTRNISILSDKYFLLGEAYRLMELPKESIKWHLKSIKAGSDILSYYKLSSQYKKLEEYDNAIEVLNKLKAKYGNSAILNREFAICNQSKSWYEHPDTNILISKFSVNSIYSDYASDYYLDDYLIISSDRYNQSGEKYNWTGNYFYNLFIIDNQGKSEPKPFSKQINEKFNDASACFNASGTEMFFVRCGGNEGNNQNCQIFHSIRSGDNWTQISLLPFIKKDVNYISPYLSYDQKSLYFASDAPSGNGGYDIYVSIRMNNGWSIPIHLPNYINSPGNEKFITTWRDEIYFSSDYLPGLGGLDLFKTALDSNYQYSPPEHLDYPLNSGGDDFSLLKDSDSSGVFSSSRIDGVGLDDIYKFTILPNNQFEAIDTFKVEENKDRLDKKVFIAIKVLENVYSEKDNPNSKILGKKPVSGATIKLANNESLITNANGLIVKELLFDTSFQINAGKLNYLSGNSNIKIGKEITYENEITTINIRIILDKLFIGKEIILKDIYYDFDKWDLRNDAIPTLTRLFNILKNNSEFKIIIGSHTDCQGDDDYNNKLSYKRAKSVTYFLLSKGISDERLKAVGYGEANLVEKCPCQECTEEQHQENRRTTFQLMN